MATPQIASGFWPPLAVLIGPRPLQEDAEEESPEVFKHYALDVPLVKKSFCKGTELKAFLPELEGRVAALVTVAQGRLKDQEDFVVLVSKKGFAKKVSLSRFRALRPGKGMPAMKLAEGDQLAWAHKAGANSAMVLGTAEGFVLRVSLGSPPAPRRGRGRRSGSAVRAIPGDAANRVRRLKALGPERVKQEEEEKRQQASVEPLTAVRAEQLDALGVALLAQGRPQEAEEAFRQSLQLASLVDAEWAANNLAVSLKAQGSERYGEAEELYRSTLKKRREPWPKPGRRRTDREVFVMQKDTGFFRVPAKALFRASPDPLWERLRDTRSPEILTSLNNLAVLLKAEGQLPEAEELYRQALSGRRRALGDLHPDTLTSINNLATLLASTGRSDEAETLYFEALEGCRKTLGEDDLDTLYSADNLGLLLFREGRAEEAEPYFRRAQQGFLRQLGRLDPEHLRSEDGLRDNLAVTLMALQRYDEAEPILREAVEGFREILGEEHPDTLVAQANLDVLLEEIIEREKQASDLQAMRRSLESAGRAGVGSI
ncbi:Kinesin light chain (KLC) [Durusdinium trenchii]|uniref:Kinesin light chain (KLC) n=1 Tax=Durusdinium trenchii TaxID=1381693 RepID=A0ABP0R2T5_9DINO